MPLRRAHARSSFATVGATAALASLAMSAALLGCGDSASSSDGATPGANGSASDASGSSYNGGAAASVDGGAIGDASPPQPGSDGGLPPPAARGATLPYWEYEAEAMTTNGVAIGPSRAFGDIATESSGRRAVRLEQTGKYVELRTEHQANSIVVRFVIPDAAGGGGVDATLGLYVNGTRVRSLALTSRYAWIYGGEADSSTNTPGPGAHHFYDEARLLLDEIPVGSTIRLQKDAQDTAAYYVIDLVDLEEVAPPRPRPAGSLSITDYGATPDDASDDGDAIRAAIAAAKSQSKTVWIPPGTFQSIAAPFNVSGVTIQGAGMWRSTLAGHNAQLKVSGDNNRFADFAILGDVTARNDQAGDNGFDGPAGKGSRLDNVWIEHMKVGWWVGKGAYGGTPTQPLTDGLVIHGLRVRNTYADGVNFCNGTSRSVVEQSHFRNTGDDSLAAWSPSFDGVPDTGNTFRFDTVQSPWRADCFAIYGGKDNAIEDSICADTVEYPGVLLATTGAFSPYPFNGTTSVARVTLSRAGGPMYGQGHGALKLFADASPVTGVNVKDVVIDAPSFSGIHVQGPSTMSAIAFDRVAITGAGTFGIHIDANARGSAEASTVTTSGDADGGVDNAAGGAWTFVKGSGNAGW